MSKLDDDRSDEGAQRRLYVRPRSGESDEEFRNRFHNGVLAMIAEYREEHPDAHEPDPLPPDDPARVRAVKRLARIRGEGKSENGR